MKRHFLQWAATLPALLAIHVSAATLYVEVNSTNATPPYTNWATAAGNIQDAVDAAIGGDEVVVADGVYGAGGRAVYGTMTNRVAVTKPLRVRSVNGPHFTIIQGAKAPGGGNGDGAIRCVYLTNGSSMTGFTMTSGATRILGDEFRERSGGGVQCESRDVLVTDCTLTANSASGYGGGAYSGTLQNCMVMSNWGGGAYLGTLNNCNVRGNSGGGAYSATLNNCTVTANSGGGASYSTLNNCIVYFNTASVGANYFSGTLNYCCTTPLPAGGTGNLDQDPHLASASHLSVGSPCRGAGSTAYARGTDIDGEPWASPPSIGCDEYRSGAVMGPLKVRVRASYTNVAVGIAVALTAEIEGRTSASVWGFGDGGVVINQPYVSHAWATAGDYAVVLTVFNESQPGGVSATLTVHVLTPVHYVAPGSANPQPPYTNWATAARTIQEAVDAATVPGAVVIVTNGTYATGGRAAHGTMTNRVAVDKPLVLRSVNGPQFTVIQGAKAPGGANGDGAIRCVYLTNGASLSGFTLANGATRDTGNPGLDGVGGGAWCESANSIITNCIMTGDSAFWSGGGASDGTLYNCTLMNNSARSGGGASGGTLNNCTLTGNSAYEGGGAFGGILNSCTLTANSAGSGGGANYASLNNCIVYFNTSPAGANHSSATLNHCCTTPLPPGVDSITNSPRFVDPVGGNYRLQSNSPCINAGNNAFVVGGSDSDGNPRVTGGTVDIGAYEFQEPTSLISYAWLQQYALPTDGSADLADPDRDRLNNWQEWRCLTNPTNALSVLRLLAPTSTVSGVVVQWESAANRTYWLERGTDLGALAPFLTIRSNIAGQAGVTTYTDTNAVGPGPFFYRVGVQQ